MEILELKCLTEFFKNPVEVLNSRFELAAEKIGEPKRRVVEIA